MNRIKITFALLLVCGLTAAPLTAARAQDPQNQNVSSGLMRGYRTGYSDGFQTGVTDVGKGAAQDFRSKDEYQHGDRAYNASYGALEDYRDAYQQGFEAGYNAGYERRPFDSSIPPDLKRRADDAAVNYPVDPASKPPVNVPATSSNTGALIISPDTIMRVELLTNLSTDASQRGDRFQARVVEPNEYQGATVNGQVTRVKRPGKVKSNAELQLAFDEIRMPDGRSSKLSAQVIEVISNGDNSGVGKVDQEGGVQGRGSTKKDVEKVGAATGIGAVIGAIAGGGVGAAIGATIGAGVGTAGVLTERGHDIHLYQGQQLRIRTAGEAEIH
jgi:hypothetical protein